MNDYPPYIKVYGYCACSVWPLGALGSVRPCGYCRTEPVEERFATASSAAAKFHDEYGFAPVVREVSGK